MSDFSKPAKKPGDIVWLDALNGTAIPFKLIATASFLPLQAIRLGHGGANYVFVNEEYVDILAGFSTVVNTSNVFIVDSIYEFDDEKNSELARNIEEWSNSPKSDFRKNHGSYGIITTTVYEEVQDQVDAQISIFNFFQAFTSLGFFEGILGLLVVSLRSISERRREIGMMRALGFNRKNVIYTVILELVAMSLIGTVIGLINGILLTSSLVHVNQSLDFKLVIPWGTIWIYIILTLLAAFIAAVIPGWKASKIPPSEALRYVE